MKIITITQKSFKDAYKEFVFAFDKNAFTSSDPDVFKEMPSVICIEDPKTGNPIKFDGKTFQIIDEEVMSGLDFTDKLKEHYLGLLEYSSLESVVEQLKSELYSRRSVISFWKPEYSDSSIVAPSLIYLTFRVRDKKLSMTVHMRANDVAIKTLLNFYIFASFQNYVSEKLGLENENYYHYIDYAIVFNKDKDEFYAMKDNL